MTTLAERYKEARIVAGLSQADLARLACTTPTTISKIEKGIIKNPRHLKLHSDALGVSEIYLSFGDGDLPKPSENSSSKQYQALSKSLRQLDKDGFLKGEVFQIINNAISIANIHHKQMASR